MKKILLFALFGIISFYGYGQCLNTAAYGSVTAPALGINVSFDSPCPFQQEYSTINSVVAGNTYTVTMGSGGFITIRSGTYNGTAVAYGNSPLTFTAPTSGTYYAHWNTNSSCGTSSAVCVYPTISCICGLPTYGSYSLFPAITCNGSIYSTTSSNCYGNEYTDVSLISGNSYTFSTSRGGMFVTILNSSNVVLAAGNEPLVWTSTITGTVKFATFVSATDCSTYSSAQSHSRRISCTCVAPTVTETYGNNQWNGYVYNAPSNCSFGTQVGTVTEPAKFSRNVGDGVWTGTTQNFPCGAPNDNFSVRYRMTYNFPAGSYIFTINADDRVRLSIDGGSTWLIAGNWGTTNCCATFSSSLQTLSGNRNLVLEFYEAGGGANVSINWCYFPPIPQISGLTNNLDKTVCYGQQAQINLSNLPANTTVKLYPESSFSSAYTNDFNAIPAASSYNNLYTPTMVDGYLRVVNSGTDPYIYMPSLPNINGDTYRYIAIRYKIASGTTGNPNFEIYIGTTADALSNEDDKLSFNVANGFVPDGNWHVAVIDMWQHPHWKGATINNLRLDFGYPAGAANSYDIYLDYFKVISPGATACFTQTSSTFTSCSAITQETGYLVEYYYNDCGATAGKMIYLKPQALPTPTISTNNNGTITCTNTIVTTTANSDIIVGTATTGQYVFPQNTFYKYSYTQQIYDASEIAMPSGIINSISFQYIYSTPQSPTPVTVYLGNTNKSIYTSLIDWIPSNQLTEVFSGTVTYNNSGTNYWCTITFNTPFYYNGQNLVVSVLNNWGTYTTSNNSTFYYHSTTDNKSIHYSTDGSPISISSPPSATSYTTKYRNNIKFNTATISYSWSTGATTNIINVTTPNTYSVTATNTTTGCSSSASVYVGSNTTPLPITITPSSASMMCGTISPNITASVTSNSTAADYTFTRIAGTYTEETGTIYLLNAYQDDGPILTITLPFNFNFAGINYSTIYTSPNGRINFNSTDYGLSNSFGTSINMLAPLWDDLVCATEGGSISTKVSGTTPNRTFIIQYLNQRQVGGGTSNLFNYQVKLYETTNVIDFIYGTGTSNITSLSATIGINSNNGTSSFISITPTNGGATSSTATANNNIDATTAHYLTSGTIYRFTPPPSSIPFTWTGGNSPNTATNTFTAGGTYSVSVTNPTNGCTSTQSVSITEIPISAPTVSPTSPNICLGSSLNLNAVSPQGAGINWFTQSSGGTAIGTSVSGANFSVIPTGTITYYAEANSAAVQQNGSLTTSFSSNNGCDGIMFDIKANSNNLTITGFDLDIAATGSKDIYIYYRNGSCIGNYSTSTGWTQIPTITVIATGSGNPTHVNIVPTFIVPINNTYGIFISTNNGSIGYNNGTTVGNIQATNTDMTIYEGYGPCSGAGVFTSSANYPRTFSGTVYYQTSSNPSCVSSRVAIPVTVNTPPTVPTGISGTTTICNGASTTLTATGGSEG
ncbi:MAG: hypothetical protein LBV69_00415, partial [Bacteroidales bacterium]|nr:hypothetical protein [Bacteroidales bacterium]